MKSSNEKIGSTKFDRGYSFSHDVSFTRINALIDSTSSTSRKVGRSQLVDAASSDLDHFLEVVLMRQERRYGLSAEQKAEIWRRWKAGESLHEIGRAFGKDHGSIQFLLSQHGGIVPTVRRRSLRSLTLAEREDISRGIASGWSIREIARGLQRAASTVSREVARHGGRPVYRASEADHRAWKLAQRPKACLLAKHSKLRMIVASKLILDWSPEQISGWLKRRYPRNESMRVSHETILLQLISSRLASLHCGLCSNHASHRRPTPPPDSGQIIC